jgi:hypothetical protein
MYSLITVPFRHSSSPYVLIILLCVILWFIHFFQFWNFPSNILLIYVISLIPSLHVPFLPTFFIFYVFIRTSWRQPKSTTGLSNVRYHNWTEIRSQWPRGLRSGSAATRLLGLWVWIPPGGWMSGLLWLLSVVRWWSLCRTDHSSRRVPPSVVLSECESKASKMRRPWPTGGIKKNRTQQNATHNSVPHLYLHATPWQELINQFRLL